MRNESRFEQREGAGWVPFLNADEQWSGHVADALMELFGVDCSCVAWQRAGVWFRVRRVSEGELEPPKSKRSRRA